MANLAPGDLAASENSLVIAPAGCGKTHLIAAAVGAATGRQLVLTHTHAGVNAMGRYLAEQRVPPGKYHVCTLDSLALRYARAFPSVSGWTVKMPSDAEWLALRPAALKALQMQAVERVLRASFAGVFVDEYQDCSLDQHAMVRQLASVLPCRVLGDPLQAIFAVVNEGGALPWGKVTGDFKLIGELDYPHRWHKKNEKLGRWLLDIRDALMKGKAIDLAAAGCLEYVPIETGVGLARCKHLLGQKDESVVGLKQRRNQCQFLAGQLKNTYSVFEDANGRDLLEAAAKIDQTTGPERVKLIHKLAQRWLTCLPSVLLKPVVENVVGGTPCKAKRPDLIRLSAALQRVRNDPGLGAVGEACAAYAALKEGPVYCSHEVWHGLGNAAKQAHGNPGMTLRDAVWQERDRHRRYGRNAPFRCLSTPLLVKGLQFDHALVLDTADFPSAESLYVAMSRGFRTLTVIGPSSTVKPVRMAS